MKAQSTAEDKGMGVPTPTLDRRFEALIFDWDGTAVPDRRADAGPVRDLLDPPKARIAELLAAVQERLSRCGWAVGGAPRRRARR
jgi:hypothetical protein